VTILFCDIYDFDSICASHDPTELIDLLDNLFSILDNMCDQFGVTKIETVNKTYMICGGLADCEMHLTESVKQNNSAYRTVELALEILKRL